MKMENNSFSIDLPGELTDNEIESVLPSFILINEKQLNRPRFSVAEEIQVLGWNKSKLENGDWKVDSTWGVVNPV